MYDDTPINLDGWELVETHATRTDTPSSTSGVGLWHRWKVFDRMAQTTR